MKMLSCCYLRVLHSHTCFVGFAPSLYIFISSRFVFPNPILFAISFGRDRLLLPGELSLQVFWVLDMTIISRARKRLEVAINNNASLCC